jgi:hypothetical protein
MLKSCYKRFIYCLKKIVNQNKRGFSVPSPLVALFYEEKIRLIGKMFSFTIWGKIDFVNIRFSTFIFVFRMGESPAKYFAAEPIFSTFKKN